MRKIVRSLAAGLLVLCSATNIYAQEDPPTPTCLKVSEEKPGEEPTTVSEGQPLSADEQKAVNIAIDFIEAVQSCFEDGAGGSSTNDPAGDLDELNNKKKICKEKVGQNESVNASTGLVKEDGDLLLGDGTTATYTNWDGISLVKIPALAPATLPPDVAVFGEGGCALFPGQAKDLAITLLHELSHLNDPDTPTDSECESEAKAYRHQVPLLKDLINCEPEAGSSAEAALGLFDDLQGQMCSCIQREAVDLLCSLWCLDLGTPCEECPDVQPCENENWDERENRVPGAPGGGLPGNWDEIIRPKKKHYGGTIVLNRSENRLDWHVMDYQTQSAVAMQQPIALIGTGTGEFIAMSMTQVTPALIVLGGYDDVTGEGILASVYFSLEGGGSVTSYTEIYRGNAFVAPVDIEILETEPSIAILDKYDGTVLLYSLRNGTFCTLATVADHAGLPYTNYIATSTHVNPDSGQAGGLKIICSREAFSGLQIAHRQGPTAIVVNIHDVDGDGTIDTVW